MKEFGRAAKFVKIGYGTMTKLKLGGHGVRDTVRQLNAAMDRVMRLGRSVISDGQRWAAMEEILRLEGSLLERVDRGYIDTRDFGVVHLPPGIGAESDFDMDEALEELELGGTMVEPAGNDISPLDHRNPKAHKALDDGLMAGRHVDVIKVVTFVSQNEAQALGASSTFDGPSSTEFSFRKRAGFVFSSWGEATQFRWKGKNQ